MNPAFAMYMDMRMPEAYIKIFRSILVAEHASSRRKIRNGGQTTKSLYCSSFTFSKYNFYLNSDLVTLEKSNAISPNRDRKNSIPVVRF
jgi:hypothetical protein